MSHDQEGPSTATNNLSNSQVLIELDDNILIQNLEAISHLQIGDKLRWDEQRQLLLVDRRICRDIRRQLDRFTRYEMLVKVSLIMDNSTNRCLPVSNLTSHLELPIHRYQTSNKWKCRVREAIQGLRRMNQTYQHFDNLFEKIQTWESKLCNFKMTDLNSEVDNNNKSLNLD